MRALRKHWPEYLVEATCLGLFMISAAAFTTLLQHPQSALAGWDAPPVLRRLPLGLAMGLTAVALIYSPLGTRSGAHMNPAVTLTYLRLGKVGPVDAVGYVSGQFAGGALGILAAVWLLAGLPSDPSVNYVATAPGPAGPLVAFGAELAISFVLMTTILRVSNTPRLARYTGIAAGTLVACYIVVEAPLSGMSMNPARTAGSNLLAQAASSLWIYFTAPPLGMLAAAEWYARRRGLTAVRCAKLHHPAAGPCIFRCGYAPDPATPRPISPSRPNTGSAEVGSRSSSGGDGLLSAGPGQPEEERVT
jgi:aquaporin Z